MGNSLRNFELALYYKSPHVDGQNRAWLAELTSWLTP
jgi:hypothetical protein